MYQRKAIATACTLLLALASPCQAQFAQTPSASQSFTATRAIQVTANTTVVIQIPNGFRMRIQKGNHSTGTGKLVNTIFDTNGVPVAESGAIVTLDIEVIEKDSVVITAKEIISGPLTIPIDAVTSPIAGIKVKDRDAVGGYREGSNIGADIGQRLGYATGNHGNTADEKEKNGLSQAADVGAIAGVVGGIAGLIGGGSSSKRYLDIQPGDTISLRNSSAVTVALPPSLQAKYQQMLASVGSYSSSNPHTPQDSQQTTPSNPSGTPSLPLQPGYSEAQSPTTAEGYNNALYLPGNTNNSGSTNSSIGGNSVYLIQNPQQSISPIAMARIRAILSSHGLSSTSCSATKLATFKINNRYLACAKPTARYGAGNYRINIQGIN